MRHELYRTLYEAKASAEEIAFRLGISSSYLRRAVLTTESGVRFPADLLVPLMHECDDYRVLAHMARECEHIAVQVSRIRRARNAAPETVNELASGFHAMAGDLMSFFAHPEPAAAAGIRQRLRKHLALIVAIEEALRGYGQLDLELSA
ncbi:MAG TPA: phage regulatory CII family protein [Gemmataceae bacterium]|nr:phage regulatory CII family protein [Gemmataceae bacterium]